MYEFSAHNVNTDEYKTVWGYDWKDAKRRHQLGDDWEYTDCEYVD